MTCADLTHNRFTPTCVGTIVPTNPAGDCQTVHPHVCGDNDIEAKTDCYAHGSPPRVWGQCEGEGDWGKMERFTPTCVGTMRG